ncbi:MAG: glycoside hydrolase family 76 protein [Acidimicrobiales bacterium]
MTTAHDDSPAVPTPQDRRVRSTRADFAFDAVMADRLYSTTHQVFGWRHWWMTRTYERLGPFAATWSALCTLASLPGRAGVRDVLPLLLGGLPAYHRDGPSVLVGRGAAAFESTVVPPLGRGGDVIYVDNAELGLALARHHELCGGDVALPLAERLFQLLVTGWSADGTWALPGGIRSTPGHAGTARRTTTNGRVASLGALLYRCTGDARTLEWALRIYRWTRSALLRDDGLYAEHIDPVGTVVTDPWPDAQGVMIGAGVLLGQATGDAALLADARATAAAAAGRLGLDELLSNTPARNAVYFRNLFSLLRVDDVRPGPLPAPQPSPDDVGVPPAATLAAWSLAAAYDDLLWDERDRRSGLFPGPGSPLSRMGALLAIDALLAGAPPPLA